MKTDPPSLEDPSFTELDSVVERSVFSPPFFPLCLVLHYFSVFILLCVSSMSMGKMLIKICWKKNELLKKQEVRFHCLKCLTANQEWVDTNKLNVSNLVWKPVVSY